MKPRLILNPYDYPVRDPERLQPPRLLVFRAIVERNIESMRRQLEEVVPGTGFNHLCPHVKTHKSPWATALLLKHGVEHFKCTPNELEMLLEAGVPNAFVAYPLVPGEADRVARLLRQYPATRLLVQIASAEHAAALTAAAQRHDVEFDCLIDLDVGGGRTGISVGELPALVRELRSGGHERLRVRGLHAYDGHNSFSEAEARASCSKAVVAEIVVAKKVVEGAGFRVEHIVAGGSPGFLPALRELTHNYSLDAKILVSPGTWIYWDTKYDELMPGCFSCAALVLAQVMDLPTGEQVTLNVGHKRWGIDQGPIHRFGVPGLEFVSASEEHTVLRCVDPREVSFGDPILLAPRHVCSTVNLWESFTLIGPNGEVEADSLPVAARNR